MLLDTDHEELIYEKHEGMIETSNEYCKTQIKECGQKFSVNSENCEKRRRRALWIILITCSTMQNSLGKIF